MERNLENTDEMEIDLVELFYALRRKAWLLAIALVAGAGVALASTLLLMTPQYEATSMIYVFTKTTSVTSLADLQIGSQLTTDFTIVATTRETLDEVIMRLNLDTTYEELVNTISVTNPSNSRILKITVENPDPVLAMDISNTLAECLRGKIAEIMNTDKPSIVDSAVVPDKPSSPSKRKNTLLGGLVGLFLAAAFVTVQFLMNDTICTEDDVEKYLGLNTLAAIPAVRSLQPKKRN